MLGVSGAVNRHGVRERAWIETMVDEHAASDRSDQVGERGGGHPCESREKLGGPGSPGVDAGSLH
jgi:hypothetical protein